MTQTPEELKKIDDNIKEQVDRLNSSKTGSVSDGMWEYIEYHGIVWKPNAGDDMGGGGPKPPTSKPSPLLEGIVEWGGSIDFANITEGSVIIIKIGIEDPVYATKLQHGVIEQVLKPRVEMLKSKKLTVLFMSTLDDIKSIEPEEMERAGWVKKDKPLIITR